MRSIFRNLGVNNDDQKIYLKMLELGAQSVSVAAKFNNIPRSSMYVVVDRLKRVGIVREFEKFGKKYIEAIYPEELRELIVKKQKALDRSIEELDTNIEVLENMRSSFSIKPTIYTYEGFDEVMKMYDALFSKAPEVYMIFNPQVNDELGNSFLNLFIKKRDQRKLKVKELIVGTPLGVDYYNTYLCDNHEIRLLPTSMNFPTDIIITKDELYMIAYEKHNIIGTKLMNVHLAQTHVQIFEELWNKYEK